MNKYLDTHKETTRYEHHGVEVETFAETKGRHREYCLCHNHCKHFKPGQPDNCPIAELVFRVDVLCNLTTPVIECPKYEEKR